MELLHFLVSGFDFVVEWVHIARKWAISFGNFKTDPGVQRRGPNWSNCYLRYMISASSAILMLYLELCYRINAFHLQMCNMVCKFNCGSDLGTFP